MRPASWWTICGVLVAANAAPQATQSPAPSSASLASSSSASGAPTSAVSTLNATQEPQRPSTVASAPSETETVKPASDNPNDPVEYDDPKNPSAVRGTLGANVLGPQDAPLDVQNPDLLAPPTTDHGSVDNAKWPFSLSHNRLQTGGWARQQNIGVMPLATEMAGVNMRLTPGSVRELHWHKTAEWAYVLKGTTQITTVDSDGHSFTGNVGPGDLWYFPAGTPHSLQALNDSTGEGSEFLLVFDSGDFSEDSTFLLTDWLAHIPKSALAKNFATDISAFDHIPSEQLYIFPAAAPSPDQQSPQGPAGAPPNPFTFQMSKAPATKGPGGSVKIVDSTVFNISKTIAAVEVEVEPNAIRELHWHPTQDEWTFYLEGNARVTLFAANSNSRTFNYQPGDVGYIPATFGHYVENIGNTTLRFLEILKTDKYQDISLNQWLALTPPDLVKAHLGFDDEMISHLSKTKPIVQKASGSSS